MRDCFEGDDNDDAENEPIGYKNPPKQHRFQNGNNAAAGKRATKKTKDITSLLLSILEEQVSVKVGDKLTSMSNRELLIRTVVNQGKKDPRTALKLLETVERIAPDTFKDKQIPKEIRITFVGKRRNYYEPPP